MRVPQLLLLGVLTACTDAVGPDLAEGTLLAAGSLALDWSADGRELFYNDLSTNDMWVVDTTAAGSSPCPSRRESSPDRAWGRQSPDERWIAYVSQEAGVAQVWVRDRTGSSRLRISTSGGADPAWLNATELSFLDLVGNLHIVDLSGVTRGVVREKSSFPTRVLTPGASRNNYGWDATGTRVLVNQPKPDPFGTRVAAKTSWLPAKSPATSVK